MLIIEPFDLFLYRAEQRQQQAECERQEFQRQVANPVEHADGWDTAIMAYFVSQPGAVVLFMTAVNNLARHCRARCKRDRERAKIILIHAIGRLIRQGRLKRVRRRFVRVNEGEVPQKPVNPLGVLPPDVGTLRPGVSVGSTPSRSVIHPAVFV